MKLFKLFKGNLSEENLLNYLRESKGNGLPYFKGEAIFDVLLNLAKNLRVKFYFFNTIISVNGRSDRRYWLSDDKKVLNIHIAPLGWYIINLRIE